MPSQRSKSMEGSTAATDRKGVFVLSALAALVGGLCCLSPVVLVLLGLASISAAASAGNEIYGDYLAEFRRVALAFLPLDAVIYFRRPAVGTLDQARGELNRIHHTA